MNKKTVNRLVHERSPYLLQHAHNPVDWYPWGQEAIDAAKREDRLIFLSIGYSTCHWCHVMERESFENEEIAHFLNAHFVSIKVDREERPEVDNLYMEFAQNLMGGQAGWPLNVFLTPDLHPIFASTYLPPENDRGLMGLKAVLESIMEVWSSDERERIVEEAKKMVELYQEQVRTSGDRLPPKEWMTKGAEELFRLSDPLHGGLSGAPKFPIAPQLRFLAKYAKRAGDSRALFLLDKTLINMARGGICDQLGGGFHRYSVDEEWFQPHFEKMVSDNAQLTEIYLHGFLLTKNPLYKKIAEKIQSYLFREMASEEGLYYTAQDADSDGVEGKFYLWKKEEIDRLLAENSTLFCDVYSVIEEGNFDSGENILFLQNSIQEIADDKKMEEAVLQEKLDHLQEILYAARAIRVPPLKDEKILLAVNSLQMASLVMMGELFCEEKYLQRALRIAQFIKKELWDGNCLIRQRSVQEKEYLATLDEYAYLVRALILMAEADLGVEWLFWAEELMEVMHHKFYVEGGAFLYSAQEEPNLLIRKSIFLDGAEPSGNAVASQCCLKLARLTGKEEYRKKAIGVLQAVQPLMEGYPSAYAFHMSNMEELYDETLPTLFLSVGEGEKNLFAYTKAIGEKALYLGAHFLIHPKEQSHPYFIHYPTKDGETTLYICDQRGCRPPLLGEEALLAIQNL